MTDLIAADVGIRQLHARFADAVWRQDDVEFSGCFASDGLWKIAGMENSWSGKDCRGVPPTCWAVVRIFISSPAYRFWNW